MASRMLVRVRQWQPIITFSSTVIAGNRRMFWKVRAMPSAVMLFGFMPFSLRLLPVGGWIVTWPCVGV